MMPGCGETPQVDDGPPGEGRQRIDKWLFFARIVKSRALAQALVADGGVSINGSECLQPSRPVKAGDRIAIRLERRDLVLMVRAAGDRRGPFSEASRLYDDLTPPGAAVPTPFERAQRSLRRN